MEGARNNYSKILEHTNQSLEKLDEIGRALNDAPYFGWVGDGLKSEWEEYELLLEKLNEIKMLIETTILR
jgi:hypothetical protein